MERAHKILSPRQSRGFTLVEMAIVLGLSAILLTVFYAFVAESMADAADESSEIKIQRGIRSPMTELIQELESGRLYAIDDYANWVCYQVPQVGPSGTPVCTADAGNNPTVIYGASAFDNANTFYPGGYYQIVFVNSTAPGDILIESKITNAANPTGQNISGTYGMGATNFAVANDKGYQLGHFEIECHDAPVVGQIPSVYTVGDTVPTAAGCLADGVTPRPGSVTSGPGGACKGPSRIIPGIALRQLDLTDNTFVSPMRTWPWGGFFFMRNPGNLNSTTGYPKHSVFAAGGARVTLGTGTWGPQVPDSFNDTNNNQVKDDNETMSAAQDINGNGFYDGPDCDGFIDLPVDNSLINQGNNVFNGKESVTVSNSTWNGTLLIKMCAFDSTKLISTSINQRDAFSSVRTISTRVKVRN